MNEVNLYRVEGLVKFLLDGARLTAESDIDITEKAYGNSKGRVTHAAV